MSAATVAAVPNFEPFRRSSPRPEGATITLTQRSTLNLSAPAAELIGTPEFVRLFWDREARVLGVAPSDQGHADALKLSTTRSGGRTVAARTFTAWAGIEVVAQRWPAYLADGVLCADLSQPGQPVTSGRARRED